MMFGTIEFAGVVVTGLIMLWIEITARRRFLRSIDPHRLQRSFSRLDLLHMMMFDPLGVAVQVIWMAVLATAIVWTLAIGGLMQQVIPTA